MSRTVLLVDDEAIVRIGVKSCVNWEKLKIDRVLEAANGQEALDVVRRNTIDVVITDLNMSVMDGFSMMEQILGLPTAPPKFIIMSCYNDYENMRKAIQYGVSDFLFKPKMFPEDIEKAISNVLGKDLDIIEGSVPETLTAQNYQEYFSALLELLEREKASPGQISEEIARFTVRLMELDEPETVSLHNFSLQLFQKMTEIKKTRTSQECLALLEEIEPWKPASLKDKLTESLSFIEAHLRDPNLNQEMVAEHIGLSTSYFCRLFKNEMNVGYASYIIQKRIELANLLLSTTTMKTAEISKAVGYTNEQYFSRLYKEYTGHSMKK